MPIKWSALKVSEAAGKIEELINQAAAPLEQARIVALEARKIDNLPQYVGQGLNSILAEIERVTGGEVSWSKEHQDGSIKRAIDRLSRRHTKRCPKSRPGEPEVRQPVSSCLKLSQSDAN